MKHQGSRRNFASEFDAIKKNLKACGTCYRQGGFEGECYRDMILPYGKLIQKFFDLR